METNCCCCYSNFLLHKTSYLNFVNYFHPLSANFTKWSNTLKQFLGKLATNCLSVFDHFVGLALKGLIIRLEKNLESTQYNACLALTGAIRARQKKKSITNWDCNPFKIDLGVENLAFFIRSWKMKILNIFSVWYLVRRSLYSTRIINIKLKHNFFKYSFFHRP